MTDNQTILETKFGPVRLHANNKHEVRLSAGSPHDEGAEAGILVNRVEYHFSMPLAQMSGSGWKLDGDPRNLYMSRIHYLDGGLNLNEPSFKARQKTVAAMEQVADDFLDTPDGQRILVNAEFQDAGKDVDRIKQEIQELEDQLRRKQSDLATARRRAGNAARAVQATGAYRRTGET